jgi:hypothetical protein
MHKQIVPMFLAAREGKIVAQTSFAVSDGTLTNNLDYVIMKERAAAERGSATTANDHPPTY